MESKTVLLRDRELQILPARPEDAAAFLRIYSPYVQETAITFEYEVPSEIEFAERIRRTLTKYPYIKAVRDGRIVGYAYAGSFKDRAAYDWSVEVSIYVDRSERGGGIGGKLYRELEVLLKKMHILNVNACIAVPREGTGSDLHLDNNSMQFHEHLGYRTVGRFHDSGYKFATWYDMIWMEKMLGEHTGLPEKVLTYEEIKDRTL